MGERWGMILVEERREGMAMYDGLHCWEEEVVVGDQGRTRLKASQQLVRPLRTQHTGSVLFVVTCFATDTDHWTYFCPDLAPKMDDFRANLS